jgi:hypothetical protein
VKGEAAIGGFACLRLGILADKLQDIHKSKQEDRK